MGNAWREAMARAAARWRARMARASGGKVGVWRKRLCIAKSARRSFFGGRPMCISRSHIQSGDALAVKALFALLLYTPLLLALTLYS